MKNDYSNKYLIETGIGLQGVDNLKNSTYFINESNRYIKGEISLDELDQIITSYYKTKPAVEERSEEADEVSIRIAKIISEDSFSFSITQLLSIHKYLFEGIYEHAGTFRKYNFIKKEWVLNGDSVTYGDFRDLEETLKYDFEQEKNFNYSLLNEDKIIEHISRFVSNLWQIHVFEEGNTRTCAVFLIKYLKSMGFNVSNDIFAKNAWYFRNSLVRANYNNYSLHIFSDNSYLIKFMRNLLLNEQNTLLNRDLRIDSGNVKTDRETTIINLIKNNSNITIEEISINLKVSLRTAKTAIKALTTNEKIKRVGGKKLGHWEIIEEK